MKKHSLILTALAVLWATTAASALARPLIEDDMTEVKSGRTRQGGVFLPDGNGKGWKATENGAYLRYPLGSPGQGGRPEGTYEVSIRVGNQVGKSSATVGVFENPQGGGLVSLKFNQYFPVRGKIESVLWFFGPDPDKPTPSGDFVSFGRVLNPGDNVTIAFVWSQASPAATGIYANGKKLQAYKWWMEPVSVSNYGYLSAMASSAVSLRVGTDARGLSPAVYTPILRVAVHDRPLAPAEMYGSSVATILSVTDDSFKVPGISGKLVAGERVGVTLVAAPGGKATFDMGNVKGIPLTEVPPTPGGPGNPEVVPGTYAGSYTVRPGDDYENGQVIGRFVSADNVAAEPLASASRWTIDTKPRVAFSIERKDLPADSSARSRVKLVAKDANGNVVKGRHVKLTLATTDEYTGTVGAGDFGKQVGAAVETRWRGETDAWGEVEFDYTAGFAAKTVILTAKDLDSGGVTVDYITAYKEASIDIMLTAPRNLAAARRGLQYIIKVEATRTELTADGKSRSVIRATVSDPNGKPAPGEPVAFTLSSPNGTLRTIAGTTDSSGVATAEYVAGKKIGIVVVTATATQRAISGNVSIILLSDAPAKIYLKARPDSLPADGTSRADLSVKVTDINDNPNKDTKVEFKVSKGGGRLDYGDRITDRYGETQNRFTAGTTPGIATVLATVRSKVPTDAELQQAKNVLFAPWSEQAEEIRVEKWLKKKGDSVPKGEPIVQYTAGRSKEILTIVAPYDLKMGDVLVEYWDTAEVGQTLVLVTPTTK